MGYNPSGGTKGLGVFTDSSDTVDDLTALLDLLARVGNYRTETETDRDLIAGDALYEGLMLFNTTAGTLEVYDGSGWEVVWGDDTGWVTTGISITAATDWAVSSYRLRRIGIHVLGVVFMAYSGSTVTPNTDGNFTDRDVMTMPAGWRNGEGRTRPVDIQQAAVRQFFGRALTATGLVRVTHGIGLSQPLTADTYEVHLNYLTE